MAENVIQQSDVSVEDVYGLMRESQKKFQEQTKSTNEDLAKQSKMFKDLLADVDLFTQKGLDKLIVSRDKMTKAQKRAESVDKKSLEVQRKRVEIDKKLIKEKEKLRQERLKETQQARRIIKLQNAEKNSVEALRAKLGLVTHAWTKLTAEELKNTKRGQRLVASKLKLTNQLKKLEKETGDNRREVGNYSLATDKLTTSLKGATRILGQFGLALGGAAILRSTVGMLAEFDEKLADIAKTTGETTQGAREISQELLKIDTRTSITNLQELASAAGRLGITGKANIVGFAQAADKVFVALGDDLDGTAEEIATELGKISSLFGFEEEFGIEGGIERVGSGLNELSASSKASAGAIQDFTKRMAGLSSILELEDVQALGALFDESGQSIEVASSTLSKLLPELAKDYERFAKIAGMAPEEFKKIAEEAPIEALKAVAEGAKSNEKGLFALTDTLKSYGVESARATGIVGVLTDNVDRLGELQGIAKKATEENTSITDEFNTKNQTLTAVYEKLINKVKAFVLGSEGATAVSEGLKSALAFVGKNLGTIVMILGKVIKTYVAYKAISASLNLKDQIQNWRNVGKNISKTGEELTDAQKSAKGFGKALTSIAWAAAISFAIDFAKELFRVASGAAAVQAQLAAIARGREEGAASVNKFAETRQKHLKDRIASIKLLALSTEEEKQKIKEATEAELGHVNAKIAQIRASKIRLQQRKEKAKQTEEEARRDGAGILRLTKLKNTVSSLAEQEQFRNEQLKGLRLLQDEFNGSLVESEIAEKQAARAAAESGSDKEKELEKEISLLRKIEDEQISRIENEFDRKEKEALVDERRRIEDLMDVKANEEEKAELIKQINLSTNLELAKIREERRKQELDEVAAMMSAIEAEINASLELPPPEDVLRTKEFERALKERRLVLLKSKKSDEEIEEDITAFLEEQLIERIALHKAAGEDTIDLELELAQLRRKNLKDETAEFLDLLKDQFDRALDLAIENSKEKQKLLDEEIDKQKDVVDALRKGDAEGNVIAEKSLALEETRLEDRERMKREEAKKEATLEEVKMLWNSINSFLDAGDSFPAAAAKGTAGTLGIKALAKSISGFFTGTKGRLGDEDKAVRQGKDGHLIWADSSEMIFNGGQVDELENAGIYTTEDATKNAVLGAQLKGGLLSPRREQANKSSQSYRELTQEMKGMRKDLASRPTQVLSPWIQDGILMGLQSLEKENGIESRYLKPFKK